MDKRIQTGHRQPGGGAEGGRSHIEITSFGGDVTVQNFSSQFIF